MQISRRRLGRALALFLAIVIGLTASPLTVAALTPEQQNVYNSGIFYFDYAAGCSANPSDDSGDASNDSSTDDSGSIPANAKEAFTYFSAKSTGYSPEQAAGIVGNLWAESSINPTTVNSIGATGIAQWLGGRLTAMRAWVSGEGKNPQSLQGQMGFVIHELNTSEGKAKTELLKTSDANGAANAVFKYYERAGDDSGPTRQKHARTILNAYASLAGSDTPTAATQGTTDDDQSAADTDSTNCISDTDSDPSASDVDCSAAVGTGKILCAAQPFAGVYYRWGGGHAGRDAFVKACPDPSNPPNNHGPGPNPSPCAVDCSGLVSMAVDAAFNKKFTWTVSSLEGDRANWQAINKSQAKPGDVLTQGDHHVEIVEHAPSGGKVTMFGAHHTGAKTGVQTSALSNWSGAYRYVGPQ